MSPLMLWSLLGAPIAGAADEPAPIDILQTALLNEAAYGNHADAIRGYTKIVREHPLNDPIRDEALLRLANAQYALGELKAARETAREGIRTDTCKSPCYLLDKQIELELSSVRTLPVHWDFSDGEYSLIHPYNYEDKGSFRVQSLKETANPALIWGTTVDVRKEDQLVIGFDHPKPAPSKVSFRIQAEDREATIRVRVVDDLGRVYGMNPAPIRVAAKRPTLVEIDMSKMVPASPDSPGLDTSTLTLLYLEDVSAFSGTAPGPHALYLDDFAIE